MQLILFDIDGTLTQSNQVDNRCFIRAACETLGLATIDSDWANYPDVTDSGVVWTLHEAHRGAPPSDGEIAAVRRRFLDLLRQEVRRDPALCRAVPGAAALLAELAATPGYAVGLATGCWRESAEMKLECAGLTEPRFPLASSSDVRSREAIMLLARERAAQRSQVNSFESAIYVGDGVWDVRAARRLGYHFVGIASGPRSDQLRREGAEHLIADYTDRKRFFEAIYAGA